MTWGRCQDDLMCKIFGCWRSIKNVFYSFYVTELLVSYSKRLPVMNISSEVIYFEKDDSNWLRRVILYVRCCFLPIVMAGTVTNLLCFAILSKKVRNNLILKIMVEMSSGLYYLTRARSEPASDSVKPLIAGSVGQCRVDLSALVHKTYCTNSIANYRHSYLISVRGPVNSLQDLACQ